jgi:hypothetical protein
VADLLYNPLMSTSKSSSPPLQAGLGRHVVVELVLPGETEHLEFDIVPDTYADFASGYLGAGTPLARAIDGMAAGSSAPYTAGGCQRVRVLQVERSTTPPPKYIAERRQQVLREALDQADRTSAMMFAASFSGKWGDYDPTGFVYDLPDEPGAEHHTAKIPGEHESGN